jgi:hypothetical protein
MSVHYNIIVEWMALAKASAADLNDKYLDALQRRKKLHKLKKIEEKLDEEFMFVDDEDTAYLSDLLDKNLSDQINLGNPERDLEEIIVEQVEVQKEIETVSDLLRRNNMPSNQVTDRVILSSS